MRESTNDRWIPLTKGVSISFHVSLSSSRRVNRKNITPIKLLWVIPGALSTFNWAPVNSLTGINTSTVPWWRHVTIHTTLGPSVCLNLLSGTTSWHRGRRWRPWDGEVHQVRQHKGLGQYIRCLIHGTCGIWDNNGAFEYHPQVEINRRNLTNLPLVPHICWSESVQHWFK